MKRLIYIASAGYSGSTLLDMILGMNSNVTSLGEVQLINEYARKNLNCTCGSKFNDCKFWKNVEERMKCEFGKKFNLSNFSLRVGEGRKTIHRIVPNLADILLIFSSPRIWIKANSHLKFLNQYQNSISNTIKLYDTISKINNSPIIVDSTKYAVPMKLLFFNIPNRLKIIHLVRDGRGVSLSYMEQKKLNIIDAARRWKRFNWNIEIISNNIPKNKILFIRYEDFCDEPDKVIKKITKFIDYDMDHEVSPLEKDKCHNINGNPMRFRRQEKSIVKSERWKSKLKKKDLLDFEKIAGKLNNKYGYLN